MTKIETPKRENISAHLDTVSEAGEPVVYAPPHKRKADKDSDEYKLGEILQEREDHTAYGRQ